jgi:hypothetical protein
MDGNYKTVYPEKKKWPTEEQQKRAEQFEKGFNKKPEMPGMFEKLKELFRKKEQK